MDEKPTFPRTKPKSVLSFFRSLDLFGRVVFVFLILFFISLFVGGGVLFFQRKIFSERGWISFEKVKPPEELTLEAFYNHKTLGRKLSLSEDGCPQKSYRVELLEKEEKRWLIETADGEQFYLEPPCNSLWNNALKGGVVGLVIEKCNQALFFKCYRLPSERRVSGVVLALGEGGLTIESEDYRGALWFPFEKEFSSSDLEKLKNNSLVELYISKHGAISNVR